jgi:HD superfamily phosphohydrolase
MSEKIIRDPVHDVIAFRLDRPLDALLFALLNAEEFQRLRASASWAWRRSPIPGATTRATATAWRHGDRARRSLTSCASTSQQDR